MNVQLIRIAVDIDSHYTVSTLYEAIYSELMRYGEPLKWLVVDANKEHQKVYVKALVSSDESSSSGLTVY